MLNYVYLLSGYLIETNEKCQVEIWHIFMFDTGLKLTHAFYGSTRTESLRKIEIGFLVLRSSSRLGCGSSRPVQKNPVR